MSEPLQASNVVRLTARRASSSPLVSKPFVKEPVELIQARKAKYEALFKLGCASKQAWAIAFTHHPRKYLTEDECTVLGLH